MAKQYLDVFYFVKDTQKESVLRTTLSNGKMYHYVKITLPHISYFARISKYEYEQISNHWSVVKDSFVTYRKNGKTYHENFLRFK